ncbi:alpha-amylase [Actinomyces oricola]|uniref:alpha-amylase n=1 Tax=Actinomyces oricola TaxID=206043 RepID=UPI000FFF256A
MTISYVDPVLMPVWMLVVAVVCLLTALTWLLRTFLVTRRDTALEVGDIPMAPRDRRKWGARVKKAAARFHAGETDLRGLHLELAEIMRGFATARSGADIESATVTEILDMAQTSGPRSVQERLRRVRHDGRPLDTNPLGRVGELLAIWEQPSFDREPDAAAEAAIKHAQEVVTQW